ncbi:MAG: hypothetical protein K2X81_19820 [Candidatus Obscuribacterales bacterium]|nr:hypothetical protein [Candidatus Obscuribacterales bacterium]
MTHPNLASVLPDIPELVKISKAIAMLDAILCEEWEYRYYSFNSHWDQDDPAQMMASMRNGSGNHYFIWFSSVGAAIKGFDHESMISPYSNGNQGRHYPGVLDHVPVEFAPFLNEPAFVINETTFCFWRRLKDSQWHSGKVEFPAHAGEDPDGAKNLLAILDGRPSTYVDHASDCFDIDVDETAVAHVYSLKPLTSGLLSRLNSERSLEDLSEDIAEIGYPVE